MGTSQSSNAPTGGVPMVPPWTPPLPPADDPADAPADGIPAAPGPSATPQLAVPRRFIGAARALGQFAGNGNRADLRRAVGHYVRKGYGGAGSSTQRFGGTVATANALGTVLANLATDAAAATLQLDRKLLAGRTADEVMDAVVEAARPVDGTQDAEQERAAIRDALSELLTRFPEADLLALTAEQRALAIEAFTAYDVARRFELDLGEAIRRSASSASVAASRIRDVRDFIRQEVASAFRQLRTQGRTPTRGRVQQVVRQALQLTLEVFEGYAE